MGLERPDLGCMPWNASILHAFFSLRSLRANLVVPWSFPVGARSLAFHANALTIFLGDSEESLGPERCSYVTLLPTLRLLMNNPTRFLEPSSVI